MILSATKFEREKPAPLMGVLAIIGFAALHNLQDVAEALGKNHSSALKKVAERNAKQSRLPPRKAVGELSSPRKSVQKKRRLL